MPKILIVEDDQSLVKVLVKKLTQEGFEVSTAANGKIGLATAIKNKPDLILLDIVMPVMDGLTMLQELRKDRWGKLARVILLTNLSDSEKVSEALQHGIYVYLVKADWKLEDVVKKVKETLGL